MEGTSGWGACNEMPICGKQRAYGLKLCPAKCVSNSRDARSEGVKQCKTVKYSVMKIPKCIKKVDKAF